MTATTLPFAEYVRLHQSVRVSGLPGYYLVQVTLPNGVVAEERAMQRKRPGLLWVEGWLTRLGFRAAD